MLPDRWNPRLWLRDWLLKPSAAERASKEASRLRSEAWQREHPGSAMDALAARVNCAELTTCERAK